jgi:biotin carboxyl carrier protein
VSTSEATQPTYSNESAERRIATESAVLDTYGEIVALAQETSSKPHFMGKVLRCVARRFASPYAAIHVRYPSEVLHDDCHSGPTDPRFWQAGLQEFLTDSLRDRGPRVKLLKAKAGDAKAAFISAPIFEGPRSTVGAMALVLAPIEETDVPKQLAILEGLARLASTCAASLGQVRSDPSVRRTDRLDTDPSSRNASAAAGVRAGMYTSAEELAFSITNELRNKLGCEQVALGIVEHRRVRIISISGLDQVCPRSPGVASLAAAMEECLDIGEPVAFQRGGDWSGETLPATCRLHKQWHAAAKGDAVASLPLQVGERAVAILSLRNRADHPFTREQLETIRTRVEPYAPAMLLALKASRSLVRHAGESVTALAQSLVAPGRTTRKLLAAIAFLATLGFFFGSLPYYLTVPCVVAPSHARHVTTPFDGVLAAAYVVAGDRVKRGDVLCEFDRRDIDQQLAKLTSELQVLEREQDQAIASDSPVEAQLAVAKQHLVKAKLDIARRRAEQTALRAPFDGVVVAGDLRTLVGSVMRQGDPLFHVAPLDHWKLELEVPQSSIADVRSDLSGVFVSHAEPNRPRPCRIVRIPAAAQVRDNKNVFTVEANVAATGDSLRPGMEGVAKLRIGSRPPWWLMSHRLVDYLRLKLWL